jgi:signal peptidase I
MTEPAPTVPRTTKRRASFARELLETAILTILIFLGVRFALQNFKVEGQSMEPNFHDGEYVLVNKIDYKFSSPARGDVIVFRAVPALQPDRDFIKRIVGLPGELVAVHDGSVFINGKRLKESYVPRPLTCRPEFIGGQVVPKDSYFVLGDNRGNSFDSCQWPTTPWLKRQDIIGKAWIVYWPLSDFTFVGSPSY